MKMKTEQIASFQIRFQTADIIPPPYAHRYEIEGKFAADDSIHVKFGIFYIEREDLTEEEIQEEGFTTEDDFEWNGTLFPVWSGIVKALVAKTKFSTKLPKAEENLIEISIEYADLESDKGIPQNNQAWEYLGQELIQAIFETAQVESPLKLIYLKRLPNRQTVQLEMNVFFSRRTVKASMQMGNLKKSRNLDWQALNPMLKLIYSGEFLAEKALPKEPNNPGKYLNVGDGLWYEFGKSLQNPNGNNRYLLDVEETLENLLPEE